MTRTLAATVARYFNIAILLVLVAALAVVYWFAWRPLPQRSGRVVAGVSQPVSVAFDSLGVPHIKAATEEDALFVQGYVTAQDRLFQMDGLRRVAAGDLAEIIGPNVLEADREARRLRLRRVAEAGYLNLPPADRAVLAAYTRGVNAFISTHLTNLPIEFTLLNYQPRPWSAVDCVLVSLQMFRNLTTTWRNDLIKREMMRAGDAQKVNFLFAARAGNEAQPGSNGWALAGSHTASGKPLLSNDMHLEYALPSVWYMAHLQAPGLNVSGVTLPGLPGIIVGHNQRIAWAITSLMFDVQDLYIEKLNQQTGQYLYQGRVEQARPERELIRVKGRPPVEMLDWVTRHGPLFVLDNGDQMALRWVVEDPTIFQFPVLEYDRAQNWQQFTAALARFPGPGSNFVYADVDGNIAYHAVGRLPIRRGYNGDVPVDGSSGNFDWEGYIPFDQLPSSYNPPSGIIVSANQNPFPADFRYPVNGNFAPPMRLAEISDALTTKSGWKAEQLLAVQKDVYAGFLKFLAMQVTAAYQARGVRNPGIDDAIALLRGWNGQMEKDLAAPLLIWLTYLHVRSAVAENAAPGKGAAYAYNMAPAVIERLLRQRPGGWFRDYDQMLLGAFLDAIEEGSRIQGRDVKRWQYGAYLTVPINSPVLHQLPLIGQYFDIGRVPMSGSSTTIKQTTSQVAPSMRMNADLANWDRSFLNILTGQSGQILSAHYRDEWNAYYSGHSFPMQFATVHASSTLEFRPGR